MCQDPYAKHVHMSYERKKPALDTKTVSEFKNQHGKETTWLFQPLTHHGKLAYQSSLTLTAKESNLLRLRVAEADNIWFLYSIQECHDTVSVLVAMLILLLVSESCDWLSATLNQPTHPTKSSKRLVRFVWERLDDQRTLAAMSQR